LLMLVSFDSVILSDSGIGLWDLWRAFKDAVGPTGPHEGCLEGLGVGLEPSRIGLLNTVKAWRLFVHLSF